jgi:hypothetical protein
MENTTKGGNALKVVSYAITPIVMIAILFLKQDTVNAMISLLAGLFSLQLIVLYWATGAVFAKWSAYAFGLVALIFYLATELCGKTW